MKPSSLSPLLSIESLDVDYLTNSRRVRAVSDFNLKVYPGQKVGLVGESGSGKSTVAYAIMNYEGGNNQISGGEIFFKGTNILKKNYSELQEIRGNQISMVYQESMNALNPSTTVGKQMMEIPNYKMKGVSKKDAKNMCLEMLLKVRIKDVNKIFNSYPSQLSGGQQQRVIIAMAFMTKPDLLILDEPTTALDVTVEAEIMELVEELVEEEKTALVLISHNLALVLNTCDEVCVMYSGQVIEQGTADDIFNHPQHPYTGALFKCIPPLYQKDKPQSMVAIPGQLPLPWERSSGCWFSDRCEFYQASKCNQVIPLKKKKNKWNNMQFVRCIRSEEIKISYDNHPASKNKVVTGKEIIKVKNLTKKYSLDNSLFLSKMSKKFTAINNVDFNIQEGEILSIVGESGSGKSTLAKMIIGMEKPSGGEIFYKKKSIGDFLAGKRSFEVVQDIQMIFQNPGDVFNPKIKIKSQMRRSIKKLLKINDRQKIDKIISKLMEVIRMPEDYINYKAHQLSGGQKQRMAIARTFAGNPSFVIADEPTSALDVSVQSSIVEMLIKMQTDYQNTLLFISHDLALVSNISNRVIVLYAGQIMEMGKRENIFAAPYHPYTEVLISSVPKLVTKTAKTTRTGFRDSSEKAPLKNEGCPFAFHCNHYLGEKCDKETPKLKEINKDHFIACHLDFK